MTDIGAIVIPDSHIWVVFFCWIGCYVAGHIIAGGAR